MTLENAELIWNKAGEIIGQPQEKEIKTMTLHEGKIYEHGDPN